MTARPVGFVPPIPTDGGARHGDDAGAFFATGSFRWPESLLPWRCPSPCGPQVACAASSIRPLVEDFSTSPVGYVEGWFVAPDVSSVRGPVRNTREQNPLRSEHRPRNEAGHPFWSGTMFGLKAAVVVGVVTLVAHSAAARAGQKKADKVEAVKPFAPAGEGFSAVFPGTPTKQQKAIELDDGTEMTITCYVVEDATKGTVLAVACNDVPDGEVATDEMFDGAVSGFVAGAGGGKPAVKKVVLGGHPGREFTFEIADKGKCRGRIYVAGGRLYQVLAAGPGDYPAGDAATKFFDSFKLSEPAKKD